MNLSILNRRYWKYKNRRYLDCIKQSEQNKKMLELLQMQANLIIKLVDASDDKQKQSGDTLHIKGIEPEVSKKEYLDMIDKMIDFK